uniref:Peptidase S8/S53 domain-containing protein n=1 Tax=Anopheles atroparvus TaxID=41427 RepID=A0AAG5D8Q7_ANOAO
MLPFILVLLTLGSTLGAGVLEESSWRTVERDLAPDALLVRLDRLVNVCVANYEDLTTDLLLGIAIANAQLRSILKQPLREPQRQFVESLAKKCDFVESRIESTFNFPSGANAVVSKLLIDSNFWSMDDKVQPLVGSNERPKGGWPQAPLHRARRRRSQLLDDDDPQALMASYLEAIDAGGPSEQQSDECLSELLVMESENEYNATGTSGIGKNQKRLTLSRECSAAMSLRKRSYGYHLTHKLLFYIVLARQRFENVDRSFVSAGQRKLCEQILREADLIAGFDFPDLFRDLFMEQVFLCAFSHHSELPEFTNPAWLAAIVGWQNGEGCFKYYADEGDGVVGPNALTTHCSTHMTGVGAALLGLFARLQLVQ